MGSPEWLKISQDDIAGIIENYDLSDLRFGAVGSHSALDVSRGAKDTGYNNIVVCKKGRDKTYDVYNKVRQRGSEEIGCVYETIIVDDWQDMLKPEIENKLQKKNTLFVPSRSTVVYLKYPGIGNFKVPFVCNNRELLQGEERSGPYSIEKNQNYLVEAAKIPHTTKFKSINDVPEDMPIIIKATNSYGKRDFERRFPRISADEKNKPEAYEQKCWEFVRTGLKGYEKEIERPLLPVETTDMAKKLESVFRNATIEQFIPGDAYVNLNFFYSPVWKELELLGADRRVQFPNGEEELHYAVSLRESLEEKAYEMGEKFVKITQKEFGRGVIGPFALQCIGDENENLVVYDVSIRIPGSPDTMYSPNSRYIYGKPVSFGERIAKEVGYAIDQDGREGLLKILS